MSTATRHALVLETKSQLLREQATAQRELEDIQKQLLAAKEKWKKNPHVKQASTREDRRDEISVFLARRELNKNSVLRQKGERQFEIERAEALEIKRQDHLKIRLVDLKQQYKEERNDATSKLRVETSQSKDIIRRAVRGEWTGSVPLSRMQGTPPNQKAGKGPKKMKDIPVRYPHSLFAAKREEPNE